MSFKALHFDHEGFRKEAKDFIVEADKGNFEDIILEAKSIIKNIPKKDWVFEGYGATLSQIDSRMWVPSRVGFAFLVLLSKYTGPEAFVKGGMWTNSIVSSLNWQEKDVKLLTYGMTTAYLMKPELWNDPFEIPPFDERWYQPEYYWWWVQPERAFNTGWLPYQEVVRLFQKLSSCQETASQQKILDRKGLPLTKEEIMESYNLTLRRFKSAAEVGVGLFHVVGG